MNLESRPAIDFALPDTAGAMHRLADYRGRWLLLVFHRHLA
jgi:peroxiredoxin